MVSTAVVNKQVDNALVKNKAVIASILQFNDLRVDQRKEPYIGLHKRTQ